MASVERQRSHVVQRRPRRRRRRHGRSSGVVGHVVGVRGDGLSGQPVPALPRAADVGRHVAHHHIELGRAASGLHHGLVAAVERHSDRGPAGDVLGRVLVVPAVGRRVEDVWRNWQRQQRSGGRCGRRQRRAERELHDGADAVLDERRAAHGHDLQRPRDGVGRTCDTHGQSSARDRAAASERHGLGSERRLVLGDCDGQRPIIIVVVDDIVLVASVERWRSELELELARPGDGPHGVAECAVELERHEPAPVSSVGVDLG